jgi:hypothetical protein
MAEVTVVYWRDIPAQVIVGKGRRGAKAPLPERDSDAYLAEWRKASPYEVAGEDAEVAQSEAARLDATYGPDRLRALIAADGWDRT